MHRFPHRRARWFWTILVTLRWKRRQVSLRRLIWRALRFKLLALLLFAAFWIPAAYANILLGPSPVAG